MMTRDEQEASPEGYFNATKLSFQRYGEIGRGFGFRCSRKSGSHQIYIHPRVAELLNLQEVRGQAKPYQIRQFLRLVEKYNLELGERQ